MKIYYEDEYESIIYIGTTDIVPRMGESIQFRGEIMRITGVIWDIESDAVMIQVTQSGLRPTAENTDNTSGRLREAHNAIMQANKRIDATEKKGRVLAEKISTVKKHLNTTIQQIKKDPL